MSRNNVVAPKIVFGGCAGVGKSTIVAKIMNNSVFSGESTVGAAYCRKTFVRNGKTIVFDIWDTAGQDRYNSLSQLYFRAAAYCILVFDLTDYESFNKIKSKWRLLAELANSPGYDEDRVKPEYILIGNKSDLGYKSVPQNEIDFYVESGDFLFYLETSAQTGDGIDELCSRLLDYGSKYEAKEPKITLQLDAAPTTECRC